jgi:hypothetical protein
MSGIRRTPAAIRRRILGPYRTLARVEAGLADVQSRLDRLEDGNGRLAPLARDEQMLELIATTHRHAVATHDLISGEIRGVLRALIAEESANRRRLYEVRAGADYAAAWEEAQPLVTVTVATRDRPEVLAARSLPSVLAQTYPNLEVIVVGDHADTATAEAVRGLGDQRITYRNLTQRLHHTDDPYRAWLVAATMARNEAMRLARGRWVVAFDDDDAMRPDCIERLLTRAREDRAEAAYGRALVRRADAGDFQIGAFPPERGRFTWACGMYHSSLRFFEREIFAADLGLPGDWFLAERMLRAGVRFGMVDDVLCDVYPSPMNKVEADDDLSRERRW